MEAASEVGASSSSSASWPLTLNPKGPLSYLYECAFCCTEIPGEADRVWPVSSHSMLMEHHYEIPKFAKTCFVKDTEEKKLAKARAVVQADTMSSGQITRKLICKICKPVKSLSSLKQARNHLDIIHDYRSSSEISDPKNKRAAELEAENDRLKKRNCELITERTEYVDKCQEQQANLATANTSLAAEKQVHQEKTREVALEYETARRRENEIRIPDQNSACKVCLVERANMMFQACNHLACCEESGRNDQARRCPICRDNICKKIVVFLS